mmetsp:Transcript_27008/g.65547  ORF Transcript_27008/g.65547 Transcript_27008/m.65547 type:complete len:142 (+) Transcript_27008:774-1199(+)
MVSALLVGDMRNLLMFNIGSFVTVGASIGERWDSFELSLERTYSGLKLMCLGRHLEPSRKITFPAIRMEATANRVQSMSTLSTIKSFFSKGCCFVPVKCDVDYWGEQLQFSIERRPLASSTTGLLGESTSRFLAIPAGCVG